MYNAADFSAILAHACPDRSGFLINVHNKCIGFQAVLSRNDYSLVYTALLPSLVTPDDNPRFVWTLAENGLADLITMAGRHGYAPPPK
jgi:hypothetical protein